MAFKFGDEAIPQTKFANGYNTNQICTSRERLISMQGMDLAKPNGVSDFNYRSEFISPTHQTIIQKQGSQ